MKIEITADGSHSLRHELLGELYHSDRGAVGEALHVYINAGFCHAVENGINKIRVFEVGFGSGLNTWLTLKSAMELNVQVEYHAVELYPVELSTASMMNFTTDPRFMELHRAQWNVPVAITDNFTLIKYLTNFESFQFFTKFDVVYYDAFTPDVQPELWSEELFTRLYGSMNNGGILTTYTAKGAVKQALRSAGFVLERLPGALGKRHMLRAIKDKKDGSR